jgi:hypothetical protein
MIDKLVDSTIGFEFLSFLYVNLGYPQIFMYLEDEKTSFITLGKTFCYRAMLLAWKMKGLLTDRWSTKCVNIILEGTWKLIWRHAGEKHDF